MGSFARVGLAGLYVGDARSPLDDVDLDDVDLTVTSPPYRLGKAYGEGHDDAMPYLDYLEWSYAWLEATYAVTSDGGRLCLNVPLDTSWGGEQRPMGPDLLDLARSAGWGYQTAIVWNEGTISRRTAWGSYARATAPYVTAPVELVYVLYKGERWKREAHGRASTIAKEDFKAWTLGLWSFGGESARRVGHPAPFPEELPRRLIELYSFKEDVVYDPFVGSGTTCLVASRLGRHSVGIDIEPAHLKTATLRLAKDLGREVLFDADGVPHLQEELAA
jgi:site-specific DNA-methyltransferase (adenine-specific)